ncbi:O-acetylhomoserine aminocarboxypropyltransferase/cysteine synthase [Aciduricibacillus chroicocephali]|uniref:O-acetylhomoserine aminocarboxypropyltransferase/cysteine synthase n=1 Tax=Aciduricibacillus chroicocephali TaxID=3054939 RepID=A0ABY9KU95_9BACI|nr:O-acetylhomoserine aminocarboxypropyltransferase/cysteine synthase [Bacillaceae bacterium 44XB]
MSSFNFQHPETQLLHGGQIADPTTGSRAVPIYQTTSYVFKDTEHAQNLFALAEPGNIYTRIGNPTVDAFEQRVALLEDGSAAVAFSSGMAAISMAIMNIAGAGDEIIADSNLYGGTYNLFVHTLPKYGINVKFVDGGDLEAIENAITDKTKAIFGEVITNPSLNVFNIEGVAQVAHKHGVPLIIDNTFATPYVCKPAQWGADIIVHSATKWMGGHGTAIGGVVVDSGRFDWAASGRFPEFTEADESYHGLKYADLGPVAYAIKVRVQLLRDIGACISPQNAFLLLQGLETLHLRIERHNDNAIKVAEYLNGHPSVEWVNFPGLENHPSHAAAKKYFKSGFGSVITFGIKGGREAGRKLIDNIELWSHVANVGDAKSLIIHPASTTHQQLNEEGLKKSGVTEELVRLAVGLESTEDTLRDLDQAIAKATGTEPQLPHNEESVSKWLLTSPFDRADGGLRQKSIAVIGADDVREEVEGLKALGFGIQEVELASKVDEQTDAIWFANKEIAGCAVNKIGDKQVKVIFGTGEAADSYRNAGYTVIQNKTPFELAKALRNDRS